MPAYKNQSNGTWYCKFYYVEWTGERKQKKKTGFTRKRDALAWEREFITKKTGNVSMTFQSLCDLYLEDMSHRLKQNTINGYTHLISMHLLPYFSDQTLSEIKPIDIRRWQTEKMNCGYSNPYLKRMNNMLKCVFQYAVRYYNLPSNPCVLAGSMGCCKRSEIQFWTFQEYQTVISSIQDTTSKLIIEILYFSGMRIGELLALTPQDIKGDTIQITKSLQRIKRTNIITPPKTAKSIRSIKMPQQIMESINQYICKTRPNTDECLLFPCSKEKIYRAIRQGCATTGVKRIRVHDLRHSHASLLIELGVSPLLIAERLGHETVQTTLTIYSHLYPNKENELIEALEQIVPKQYTGQF